MNKNKRIMQVSKFVYILTIGIFASSLSAQNETSSIINQVDSNIVISKREVSKKQKNADELLFETIRNGNTLEASTQLHSPFYYKTDKDGETALTLAIKQKDVAMVKLLTEKAVINLKNAEGETPLTLALKSGEMDIVNLIIKRAKAALKNNKGETPLVLSFAYDDLFLVQTLLNKGADPNAKSVGVTPLFAATQLGNINLVALLVKNKALPNIPNDDGAIPLYAAVQKGSPILTGILLYKSPTPEVESNWKNEIGETLGNLAIIQGNEQIVRLLLDYGYDPDQIDYLENTGLLKATELGHENIAMLFLIKGADPDIPNIMGTTPIMVAAKSSNSNLATTLASYGANPEHQNFEGIAANDFGNYTMNLTDSTLTDEIIEMTTEGEEQP